MNKVHICPRGHQWEAPASETAPSCPRCLPTVVFDPAPALAGADGERTVALPAPAADAEAITLFPGPSPEDDLPATVFVPGYEVLGVLGRGGMGVVYKARDVRLHRLVALKMILAGGHASPQHLVRFHIEAEAAARLQHPNIVQIYDVGEARTGPGVVHPFMALEFCPGGSLAERLDGTPVPARPAAELMETLARAMHHAHEAGILHRDLKPANILLSSGGCELLDSGATGGSRPPLARCLPKITDFGLAKLLQPDSAHPPSDAHPTASGAVMGTPSYMAPEQAGGSRRPAGPSTDIYSLGAILYELLTGRPPFKGTSPLETVLQVLHTEPVSPHRLQPGVPNDLETICLKCLHKEPGRRYATAAELAEDLHRWLSNEPIRARRIGATGRLTRWCRRNPVLAGVSAGATVLVLLLSVLYARSLHRRLHDERAAREQLRAEHEELVAARENAENALARSLYEQARAVRQSPAPGRQWRVLHLLQRAEKVRHRRDPLVQRTSGAADDTADLPTRAELRSEAVAALLFPDGRVLRRLNSVTPLGCSLSRDGTRAVSLWLDEVKREGGIRVCDLRSGRVLGQSRKGSLLSGRFALSPDGQLLAVPSTGGVELLEMPSARLGRTLRFPGRPGIGAGLSLQRVRLAFSPDGKQLALVRAVSEKWDLALWDVSHATPRLSTPLAGPVHSLAFSGDGKVLLYARGTRTLGTIDLKRGKKPVESVLPLALATSATRGLGLAPQRLACSPTASLAALACMAPPGQGVVLLWDFKRRLERRRWQGGLNAGGFPLAFSHDGATLAAGAADGSVQCYPLREGAQTIRLERVHLDGVGLLGWDAAGHLLSAGKFVGALHVWELSRPGIRSVLDSPAGTVRDFALSPDGRWVALQTRQKRGEITLLRRGAAPTMRRLVLANPPRGSSHLLFRPDSRQLALIASNRAVVWEVEGGKEVLQRRPGEFGLSRWFAGTFLADGRLLVATPRAGGGAAVWDLVAGKRVHKRVGEGSLAWAFLAGGGRFLLVLPVPYLPLNPAARSIVVWDVATVRKRAEVRLDRVGTGRRGRRGRNVFWARLSPDGERLAWLDLPRAEGAVGVPAETFVNVQKLRAGGKRRRIRCGVLPVGAAFSPDGRLLAIGFADGSVQLRDARAGVELFRWSAHEGAVRSLEFSADGTALASAAEGTAVKVLKLAKLRRRLAVLRLDW